MLSRDEILEAFDRTRHRNRTSKVSGRGVMLMQMFMDEVDYNEPGNAVTLVKKRSEQDKLS